MARPPSAAPASSRNSASYSLQTLSRPSSLRPSSLLEHPIPSTPPRRQLPFPNTTPAAAVADPHTRDAFLPQDVDRYDRIWGDMAARMGDLDTLATKPATDMRLVSEAHAKSVEQFREAQIRLAETWAGSESRLGSTQSSLLEKLANSAAGIEEAEISDADRSKMNDQVFDQMEHEVGVVMAQLEEVIHSQGEVEKVSRDMWRSTLSIAQGLEKEAERKEENNPSPIG